MLTANEVADWFLVQAAKDDVVDLSNKKLQKLIYFAHAHMLSATGDPLVGDRTVAHDHGPVYWSVYHRFKRFGWEPISSDEAGAIVPLTARESELLRKTWIAYRGYTANELEQLTHLTHELNPYWLVAKNETMPDDEIRRFVHDSAPYHSVALDDCVYISARDEELMDEVDTEASLEAAVAYMMA